MLLVDNWGSAQLSSLGVTSGMYITVMSGFKLIVSSVSTLPSWGGNTSQNKDTLMHY